MLRNRHLQSFKNSEKSRAPAFFRAVGALYRAIQFGESPLSRLEREAIAVVVSAANQCQESGGASLTGAARGRARAPLGRALARPPALHTRRGARLALLTLGLRHNPEIGLGRLPTLRVGLLGFVIRDRAGNDHVVALL